MANLSISRLIFNGVALLGIILLVVQSGCSLPGSKPAPTYPGLPYQSNYAPTYSPSSVNPNNPAYGQWNSGYNGAGQPGNPPSFNSVGFTGQTC